MGKITLKTIERKTTVTREAVRAAVAEVFKDDERFNNKPANGNKQARRNAKKPA